MTHTVYTNYWMNRRDNVIKEHGTFNSEEEALQGIKAWWELQGDDYSNVEERRTNSGALEITYGDDNYYYRIISSESETPAVMRKPKKRQAGELDAMRRQRLIDDSLYFFEELAEPYQDRLLMAMGDGEKALKYLYDEKGRLVKLIEE